jgi:1,4-dihydroxy-2-naphthoate octaprenyltransferase
MQKEKNSFALWLEAARPKTLPAALAPVIVGAADAARFTPWDPWKILGCLGLALGLQIAANFFNDADDGERGTDKPGRAGPRRLVADGIVSAVQMRLAGVLMLAIVAAIALWAVPFDLYPVWIMGAAAALAAAAYTGIGIAYGYKGLGELICFIFFGPVAVLGTTMIVAREISPEGIVLGIACGLLSVAILEVNNIRDANSDKKAGKMTLAARFGREVGQKIYFWVLMSALLANAILAGVYFWTFGAIMIVVMMGARLHATLGKNPDGPTYNRLLAMTARMQLLWALAVAIGLWLGPINTTLGKH